MKRCPRCQQVYKDGTLKFCRDDGTALISESAAFEFSSTLPLPQPRTSATLPTQYLPDVPSIAVLAFVNMSADAENDYFCDGLAEELLNALAKIEGLKVAARTSAFSFKGKDINISEIGRALNVKTVLEGSVRKAGNRLRITTQLIDVADGYHMWSERYDRETKDIFDVQDEITLAVVDALKVKLLGEEKAAVLKRYTDNPEAYELFLKGRYHYHAYTGEGWKKAVEFFEQAVEREPEYAPAHGGIAACLIYSWFFGALTTDEAIPKWRAAATRALEIDPDLADANTALGGMYFYYEWEWDRAEPYYRRAVEINPQNADAHLSYGLYLAARGRASEALREGQRARETDPLSLLVNLQVGWIFLFSNSLERAAGQVRRMIELEPNFHGAYWQLGAVRVAQGKHEEAVEAFRKSLSLGGNQNALSGLGGACALLGKREEASDVIRQLLEMRGRQPIAAFNLARVYSCLGELDSALEWLEKACEERNGEMVFLNAITGAGTGELWGTALPRDPRFRDLLRRMRLAL
jgi:serine/threonine-protein kinase